MYAKYSEVSSSGPYPFAEWRPLILEKKQPRKIFVQSNTHIKGNNSSFNSKSWFHWYIVILIFKGETVKLLNYEANHAGMIQSWNDRFEANSQVYQALDELWAKDAPYFG